MDAEDCQILKDQVEKDSSSQETQLIIPPEDLPEGVFIVDSLSDLRGHCKNYISSNQIKTRDAEQFQISSQEHPNWEMIACHFRNTKYTQETVRNPSALRDSFVFLVTEYLPLVVELLNKTEKRNRLIHFIYDRMIAIRCQYHVQGLIDPKINLQIIKAIIYLQTLGNVPTRIVGLDSFLLPNIKRQLLSTQQGVQIFKQALMFSIVKSTKFQLIQILSNHCEEILNDQALSMVLGSKRKIIGGSYRRYFKQLASNKNLTVRLIYWGQYEKMKEMAISAYKKSKMNEKAPVICKILCYKKMEGWVNISQPAQWQKLQKYQVEYDLKVKLWVGQKNIKQCLEAFTEKIKHFD